MIEPLDVTHQEYYIIFTQGVTHWITRWLKPNFSHINLITRDKYNWIILNPTRLYLQLLIPPITVDQNPLPAYTTKDDTVLHIKFAHRNDKQQFGNFGMLNCVTWSKYMLGIRVNSLTPWRLYQRLLNFSQSDLVKHGIISIKKVQL